MGLHVQHGLSLLFPSSAGHHGVPSMFAERPGRTSWKRLKCYFLSSWDFMMSFFFWWIEMAMMWLAFCHKTYKGPKEVGLIRKEGGYNVWRGLLTILSVCDGHLVMIERKCGMDTSWAWHLGMWSCVCQLKEMMPLGAEFVVFLWPVKADLAQMTQRLKARSIFNSDTCQQ